MAKLLHGCFDFHPTKKGDMSAYALFLMVLAFFQVEILINFPLLFFLGQAHAGFKLPSGQICRENPK
jgi:hypothetical protein